SLNVLKMAREGLLFDLQAAINKAKNESVPVRKENVQVEHRGEFKNVNLEVVPLKVASTQGRHFLVVFEDATPASRFEAERSKAEEVSVSRKGKSGDPQTIKLKQELAATKHYLRSIVEEREASNEELQA